MILQPAIRSLAVVLTSDVGLRGLSRRTYGIIAAVDRGDLLACQLSHACLNNAYDKELLI